MVENKQTQTLTQRLEKYLADWNEIKSIKQWRLENNIEVNPEYLRKVTKSDQMKTQFWMYMTAISFAVGLILGVSI